MKHFSIVAGALLVIFAAVCLTFSPFSNNGEKLLCRLKLGPTSENEILLEIADASLLIYRDGNLGSSPESYPMSAGNLVGECDIPPFKIANTEYTILRCHEYSDKGPPARNALMIHCKIKDEQSNYTQYCDVELSANVDSLSTAYFDGPLNVSPQLFYYTPTKFVFRIDGKPTDVRVSIGTADETIGCWTMVSVHDNDQCSFPRHVRPTATIDFPGVDSTVITKTYVLDQFC